MRLLKFLLGIISDQLRNRSNPIAFLGFALVLCVLGYPDPKSYYFLALVLVMAIFYRKSLTWWGFFESLVITFTCFFLLGLSYFALGFGMFSGEKNSWVGLILMSVSFLLVVIFYCVRNLFKAPQEDSRTDVEENRNG